MNEEILWHKFEQLYQLSSEQCEQFKTYVRMLDEWNRIHNITRITGLEDTLSYHFADSLILTKMIDCTQLSSIADVGSGGGFPGIPLAIKYPHLKVTLIEVNLKKGEFLSAVIQALGLSNVSVNSLDWRTFLRSALCTVDLFVARASLHTDELVRMFKSGCYYQNSKLVYWAARAWEPTSKDIQYVHRKEPYTVGNRLRLLVFFEKK
jgi:16S rRNA (guanine(527)-N(7))-methyltransferase RsmG